MHMHPLELSRAELLGAWGSTYTHQGEGGGASWSVDIELATTVSFNRVNTASHSRRHRLSFDSSSSTLHIIP